MNERIKELAKQAGIWRQHYDICDESPAGLEKFAELIVQECISLFDGTKEMKTIGMLSHSQVIRQIEKHFGVE